MCVRAHRHTDTHAISLSLSHYLCLSMKARNASKAGTSSSVNIWQPYYTTMSFLLCESCPFRVPFASSSFHLLPCLLTLCALCVREGRQLGTGTEHFCFTGCFFSSFSSCSPSWRGCSCNVLSFRPLFCLLISFFSPPSLSLQVYLP